MSSLAARLTPSRFLSFVFQEERVGQAARLACDCHSVAGCTTIPSGELKEAGCRAR